jgi:hypothetical protein
MLDIWNPTTSEEPPQPHRAGESLHELSEFVHWFFHLRNHQYPLVLPELPATRSTREAYATAATKTP